MARALDVMGTKWRAARMASCIRRVLKKGPPPTYSASGRSLTKVAKAGDLAAAAGLDDPDLQPHGTSSRFHVSQYRFGAQAISRIDKHGNASCSGHQLAQEFKPLCHQLVIENIETCQIAARR